MYKRQNLGRLKLLYGGRSSLADVRVRKILSKFYDLEVEEIFAGGLHEFLTDFISEINEISSLIDETYFKGIK